MTLLFLLLAVACLAYANGANDNFKGVATLFGSGAASFRLAVAWATLATFAGSLTAVVLSAQLLKSFSGRGLIADDLVNNIHYVSAVAAGAGLTVLLATRLGIPISTTHGLVGALVGAGWAAGSDINLSKVGGDFFVPLLVSPLIAFAATCLVYPVFRFARVIFGIAENTCLCVGGEVLEVVPTCGGEAIALERMRELSLSVGTTVTCQRRYQGRVLGVEASAVLDGLHFFSAGVVCFARGLNDTPKIAALLLLAPWLGGLGSTVLVGLLIAAGGVLGARRIADTMSGKITPMNHGQGCTANLLTGIIVIGASRFGLPVSTTHVSCGTLFGIGAVTGKGHWPMVGKILAAWTTTLPLGAALGAVCFLVLASI